MPYPVIKSGIGGLTRQLSSYYGKYGIRINSICSGGIKGKVSGSEADMDNSFMRNTKKVPLRRMATTDDIANGMFSRIRCIELYHRSKHSS